MKKVVYSIISIIFAFVCLSAGSAQSDEQSSNAQPKDGLDENLKAGTFAPDGSKLSEIAPPIPTPPAVALPTLVSTEIGSKSAFNWRCRALSLANEYPLKKNSSAWTLLIDYKQGQLLLKQAIMQMGLTLISEYDDAGQFLISLPESNKKEDIIIISQPAGEASTLFKMHTYTNRVADIEKINCLPVTMKNLLENRGLWQ